MRYRLNPNWEDVPDEQITELLRVMGLHAQGFIMRNFSPNAPSSPGNPPAVVTGNLRANIKWEMDNGMTSDNHVGAGLPAKALRIGIGPRASYGAHLEFGTRNIKARPFLLPAVDNLRATFKEILGEWRGN